MDITRANMDALFIRYNKAFKNGFALEGSVYKPFTMEFKSTTSIESYPFLKKWAGMREWIGPRKIKNLSADKMEVKNKKFEDSVSVNRDDIEDDTFGLYDKMFEDLGFSAAELWPELAIAAMIEDSKWMDGDDFYSDIRKYGDGDDECKIINVTSAALSADTFDVAYKLMSGYLAHNNKKLKVKPNLLIHGPNSRRTAFDILKNDFIASSGSKTVQVKNYNKDLVASLELPELGNEWFLTQTKGVFKPVAVQKRVIPGKITRKDKDEDDNVFERDEYVYGTRARGRAFKTMPHLIYRGGI